MAEDAKPPAKPKSPAEIRQERLAAALRANLRKRKDQARQRDRAEEDEGAEGSIPSPLRGEG